MPSDSELKKWLSLSDENAMRELFDAAYRKKLEKKAADPELGVNGRVCFEGMVEDVAAHIEKASLFILASAQEGMPNALIEAMALGLPCISTDCPCGGPADLIANGENGILVPVGDRQAMKDAMVRVLEDPALADKLGTAAAAIQEKLDPATVNRMWKTYFDTIVK